MVIGILGDNPFGSILDETVRNKTVNGRKLVVKHFRSIRDVKTCHILFVSSSEKTKIRDIVGAFEKSSVLTVGDMDEFAESGGIANFVVDKNRMGLKINTDAVKTARLKISYRLLKLAKVVKSNQSAGK